MSIGKLSRVPATRRSRFKGAQGQAGVAAPDAAPAQKPVESMQAEVGHRRQHTAEAGAAHPPRPAASQDPESGVHSAFDYAVIGMALVAPDGRWLKVNRALCGIVGYSEPEMLGLTYHAMTHPDDLAIISAHAARLLAGEIATYEVEKRDVHKRGHKVHVFLSMSLVRDGNGAPLYFIWQVQDISVGKSTEEALFGEQERARVTLNSIGDAVLTTDIAGNINYLNVVAERMTGWCREEAEGRPLDEVFHILDGDSRLPARNPAKMALAENKTVDMAAGVVLVQRNGHEVGIEDSAAPIHDRDGKVTGAVLVFHDVTRARELAEKMAHLAHYDALTDLPNRVLLNERFVQATALARRHGRKAAILFLDVDRFKHINDSLGHGMGDKLLLSVATRLLACVRVSDTVSRQGGDEFLVLLPDIEHPQDAAHFAKKILTALALPHRIDAQDLHVTMSIGNWVLREACRQAKAWVDAGVEAMPVAVNISAVQFRHKGFLEDVRDILTETGLEPGCLELELTESVLMPDAKSTGSTLRALKTLGVQLSVDDFGTGYSSLSYLTQFPIDTLKIDQSFVHKMLLNANDASVISAVISMGRDLNQRVIAEGVETEEQLRFLQTRQCNEGQGFYFCHPLNVEDFATFVRTRASPELHGGH